MAWRKKIRTWCRRRTSRRWGRGRRSGKIVLELKFLKSLWFYHGFVNRYNSKLFCLFLCAFIFNGGWSNKTRSFSVCILYYGILLVLPLLLFFIYAPFFSFFSERMIWFSTSMPNTPWVHPYLSSYMYTCMYLCIRTYVCTYMYLLTWASSSNSSAFVSFNFKPFFCLMKREDVHSAARRRDKRWKNISSQAASRQAHNQTQSQKNRKHIQTNLFIRGRFFVDLIGKWKFEFAG